MANIYPLHSKHDHSIISRICYLRQSDYDDRALHVFAHAIAELRLSMLVRRAKNKSRIAVEHRGWNTHANDSRRIFNPQQRVDKVNLLEETPNGLR